MARRLFPPLVALTLAALVAACATPQQQCVSAATKELAALQKAIATAEGNIARGYAIHRQTISRQVADICYRSDPDTGERLPYSCIDTEFETIETPVPIDVRAEQEKLAGYRAALPPLEARSSAAVAQCRALYPE
jgi:hypothetical protein